MPFPQTPSPLNMIIAAKTYNAAWFSGSTNEIKITNAIAGAVADGAKYVFVPANMIPYNVNAVTLNTAVKLITEGSQENAFDVRAYGAAGDGVTDDTLAIQAALTQAGTFRGSVVLSGQGLTYKTTAALVFPTGVSLDLGSNKVLSSSIRIFSLDFYSGVYSDSINATVQSTSTAAGSLIGAVSTASAIGPFYLRNFFLVGAGSSNTNTIAIDLTALHDGEIEFIRMQGTETGILGANGGGICYRNKFREVDIVLTKFGWDLNLGANDWLVLNGQVNGGDMPFDANGVSGLVVIGLNMEGFTVRGPRVTDCENYIFLGCRTEAGAGSLDTYTHAGTSYGSVVNPTIGGLSNDIFNVTGSGFTLIGRRIVPGGVITLTDAASIVIDERLSNVFTVTLGGNRTMAAPTQPIKGQRLTFIIVQDGTGGRTLAWNAIFKQAWSDTGNTANKMSTISYIYNGTNYVQDGAQSPYI